jgi:hypothetical protein
MGRGVAGDLMLRFPFRVEKQIPLSPGALEAPQIGEWRPRFFMLPNPATGTNLIFDFGRSFPNRIWRLGAVSCVVETDANVANRSVTLSMIVVGAPQVDFEIAPTSDVLTANNSASFYWTRGIQTLAPISGLRQGPIPEFMFLTTGRSLQITVYSIQTGDKILKTIVNIEERSG